MPGIFVLSALRNLLRHKLQSLINIASLAIGLTVFGFAYLYVKQELSWDRGWPDASRVHRLVVQQQGIPGAIDGFQNSMSSGTWAGLASYFGSDIEAASRVATTGVRPADGPDNIATNLWFVDAPFLDIFQPEVIEGDLGRALSGPSFIALEEKLATQLGLIGHVGERFAYTFIGFQEAAPKLEYELAAIYRFPGPVSFNASFTAITLLHDYSKPLFDQGQGRSVTVPWERPTRVWIKLRDGVQTAEFNALQPAFVEQNVTDFNAALGSQGKISEHLFYRWQPLPEIYFNSPSDESLGALRGDAARVATFAVVGLLVLLVGCSNSVSLSLAAALERRREIGVRKAAGALPRDILWQHLGESLLLALLALIPAIAALELLLPAFRALLPVVRTEPGWKEYLLLGLIAGGAGLACGAYPALVLSSTRPQLVLRAGGQQGVKGGSRLRTLLVAAQFCFASMLLVGTAALYLQLTLARAQPLGFDASNTVLVYKNNPAVSLNAFKTELGKIPGVVRVIQGSNFPNVNFPLSINATTLVRNTADSNGVQVQGQINDFDFVEMMGMRMLAGRDYDASMDSYSIDSSGLTFADGTGQRTILNAAAVRQLGFATPEDAVDATIYVRNLDGQTREVNHRPLRIIGIVEDNLYQSLRRRPGPEMYSLYIIPPTVTQGNIMLQYEEAVEESLQESIRRAAEGIGSPVSGMAFSETMIESAFQLEQNESKLLLICGALSIVLASFGLYGLAAFAIAKQVKEVGVRKVMGAGVGTIVSLYLWRFARPIVVANLVAWPVAIYFVLQWIERFPYQLERAWLAPLCIGTLGAVLLIAMLTVSVITTRAATANPVRSLRYE